MFKYLAALIIALSLSTLASPALASSKPPQQYPDYTKYIHNTMDSQMAVYEAGIAYGNRAGVFIKIGDSLTSSYYFLRVFAEGRINYGYRTYLSKMVIFYSALTIGAENSFTRISYAAVPGSTSAYALSNVSPCGTQPTPFQCEVAAARPSLALLMTGTNDLAVGTTPEVYRANLIAIVRANKVRGIIPVLYTLPRRCGYDVTVYNAEIVRVALWEGIPYIDYGRAMAALPDYGLSEDCLHPSRPEDGNSSDFSLMGLTHGYNVRNLLTLEFLRLWEVLRLQYANRYQ